MDEKNMEFSSADLSRLLRSREAMALAAMLRQMDGQTLSRAASLAQSGRTAEAKQLLSPLMDDPKVQRLLRQMEGRHGGI